MTREPSLPRLSTPEDIQKKVAEELEELAAKNSQAIAEDAALKEISRQYDIGLRILRTQYTVIKHEWDRQQQPEPAEPTPEELAVQVKAANEAKERAKAEAAAEAAIKSRRCFEAGMALAVCLDISVKQRRKTRSHQMRIAERLVRHYFHRFVNRTDALYRQWANDGAYGYKAIYDAVTVELIVRHLTGRITVSFPALSANGLTRWIAFDDDRACGRLDKIQDLLSQHGWLSVREGRREGKDGHLWVFFSEPIPAADAIRFGRCFQRAAGVPSNADGFELFPKQDRPMKLGSALRGPLGIHFKPGANMMRGWFDGPPQDVTSQLEWFAEQEPNLASALLQFSEELRLRELPNVRSVPQRNIHRNGSAGRLITILELVPDRRRSGSEWVAQCPICAAANLDQSRNNLHISLDGKKFCCWYDGKPGKIHKAAEIIRALKNTTKVFPQPRLSTQSL